MSDRRARPHWLLPSLIVGLLSIATGLIVLRANVSRTPALASEHSLGDLVRRNGRLLIFRSREGGPNDRRMAAQALGDEGAGRILFNPRCERIAASALYIVCLGRSRDVLRPYQSTLFDHDLRELGSVLLNGSPSRTRVSPDEKYFATTSFVVGDSYSDDVFSTRTFLHRIGAGDVALGTGDNVEDYELILNQEVYRFPDKNVWGVTFVPGQDRFFATVSMSGHRYLVDANIRERRMLALRDNVECPSLSPNGLRIAYKKRIRDGQIVAWRFRIFDVVTGSDTELGETRSIDDQIAWLDDDHVLYGVPRPDGKGADIWSAPINGGPPVMLVANGDSPTVIGRK
jgi:hypothetical protein